MILLIIVLGLIVRLLNINQSLWLDEAAQAILSSQSINQIIFDRANDFHPPLFYLLSHFWLQLGTGDIFLRLLPLSFGLLTIYGVYLLGQELFSKRLGLLSAILLSLAPYHVYYSQEFRMYSLVVCLAVYSQLFLLRWSKNQVFISSLGYVLTTAALIYSHYMGFLLIFSQISWVLIFWRRKLLSYLLLLAMIGTLWLPWLPFFWQQLSTGVNANQYLPGWGDLLALSWLKALPLTFFKFIFGRIDFANNLVYGLVAVIGFVIVSLVSWPILREKKRREVGLLFSWLLVPVVTSFLLSFKVPVNQPFRLLFVLPALYLIMAWGILQTKKWQKISLASVTLISLFGLTLYLLNTSFWREDWKAAVKSISQKLDSQSEVVFTWPTPMPPYTWYNHDRQAVGIVTKFPAQPAEIEANLKLLSNKKNLYLFEYLQPLADPQKLTIQWLENNGYQQQEILNFRGVGFVYHYHRQ